MPVCVALARAVQYWLGIECEHWHRSIEGVVDDARAFGEASPRMQSLSLAPPEQRRHRHWPASSQLPLAAALQTAPAMRWYIRSDREWLHLVESRTPTDDCPQLLHE